MRIAPIPLTNAVPGSTVRVARIDDSGASMRRLLEMGVVEDTELLVSREASGGAVIIRLGESRLAVSREMAARIWVAGPDR